MRPFDVYLMCLNIQTSRHLYRYSTWHSMINSWQQIDGLKEKVEGECVRVCGEQKFTNKRRKGYYGRLQQKYVLYMCLHCSSLSVREREKEVFGEPEPNEANRDISFIITQHLIWWKDMQFIFFISPTSPHTCKEWKQRGEKDGQYSNAETNTVKEIARMTEILQKQTIWVQAVLNHIQYVEQTLANVIMYQI